MVFSLLHQLSKAFEDFRIFLNQVLPFLVDPTLEQMVTSLLDLEVLRLLIPVEGLRLEVITSFHLLSLHLPKIDVLEPFVLKNLFWATLRSDSLRWLKLEQLLNDVTEGLR